MATTETANKGAMDIKAHQQTWGGFITVSWWTIGIIIVILALLGTFLLHSPPRPM